MTTVDTIELNDTQALFERIAALEARVNELEAHPSQGVEDRVAMVVFSGELDKAIAAFIIATGAASMGLETSMFFTFWGINAVKKQKVFAGKSLLEQGFTAMLPGKLGETGLSQMNFFGAGAQIIRGLMKRHEVSSPEELFGLAQELGVRMDWPMFRSLFGGPAATATRPATITAPELKQRLDAGEKLHLLDVRSSDEYAHNGRIAGSHLLPLPMLAMRLSELPQGTPIVCICRSGNRSGVAAEQLARQGFADVINLTGGMIGWARAGLPTQRG